MYGLSVACSEPGTVVVAATSTMCLWGEAPGWLHTLSPALCIRSPRSCKASAVSAWGSNKSRPYSAELAAATAAEASDSTDS